MDYLRKLAKQNIKMVNASARAILDQVIAGEYAMALQIFNHHAAISASKGAPVDWLRLSPATVTPGLVGLTKDAPASQCRAPVRRVHDLEGGPADLPEGELPAGAADVPPLTSRTSSRRRAALPATVLTPAITDKAMDRWDTIAKELFR